MIKVVLDTDADNEIDDQYAISYLIKSGRADVLAINAAPYLNHKVSTPQEGMEKSFDEILHILSLSNSLDQYKDKVFKGSFSFLRSKDKPIYSEAAFNLVQISKDFSKDNKLYVVAIGALTNIASALIIDHSIKDRIHVVFLGGVATHLTNNSRTEFNLSEDVLAAQLVFQNVDSISMLPGPGVISELRTTKYELEHWLKGKNKLCNYLVEHTINEADSYAFSRPWSRVIWDISAIAYLFNKNFNFMAVEKVKRFYPVDQFSYGACDGLDINYVNEINRDLIFEDLFDILTK